MAKTCLRCDVSIETAQYVELEAPLGADAPPTVAGSVCRSCANDVARTLGFDWDADDRDRPQRSEPADFGGGESTGVQDLLGGDDA